MQVLSILQRVLPERPRLSLAPLRQRAVDLARALLAALVRRLTRLLAGAAEPPAPRRRPSSSAPRALTGTAVTVPARPAPPPRPDLGSFLDRVRRTRDHRERAAALERTLADLEQIVGLLRGMNRPGGEIEGLERSYLQIQQLADPDVARTGGELNMAWLLLERELRAVAERL